jgi:methionine-rich copper-binding protein CopC
MKNIPFALAMLFAMSAMMPALAHARLEKTDPAAGTTSVAPVAAVNLYYSEELEPDFSKATLADDEGNPVDAVSSVDAKNPKHLVLTPKTPLGPGAYHLNWYVLSIDTHKTQGSYKFKVAP